MTSPSLELQAAMIARLKSSAALTAIVGSRIYDEPAPKAGFPYLSWGPEQSISEDADCITGYEISIQIDAWSQTVGLPEVKRISEEVRSSLHEYDFDLAENALVLIEHRQTQFLRDPDGKTNHAVIEFTAFIEQP